MSNILYIKNHCCHQSREWLHELRKLRGVLVVHLTPLHWLSILSTAARNCPNSYNPPRVLLITLVLYPPSLFSLPPYAHSFSIPFSCKTLPVSPLLHAFIHTTSYTPLHSRTLFSGINARTSQDVVYILPGICNSVNYRARVYKICNQRKVATRQKFDNHWWKEKVMLKRKRSFLELCFFSPVRTRKCDTPSHV